MEKSMSLLEEAPVKASPWPETEPDSMERPVSCGSMFDAFEKSVLDTLSGKTCRERSRARRGRTSDACSQTWMSSGTVLHGEFSTRNSSEWPSDAAVSFLSEALETDVPQKYSLSTTACAGIIRRAETRGKALPRELNEALLAVVALGSATK